MPAWIGHRKRCTHEFKIELSGELQFIIPGIPGIINITYFLKMSSVFYNFFGLPHSVFILPKILNLQKSILIFLLSIILLQIIVLQIILLLLH